MINKEKVLNLTANILETLNAADISMAEYRLILKGLIATFCEDLIGDCNTQEALDFEEQQVQNMLTEAYQPFFDKRRQELIDEGVYSFAPYSKDDLLNQINTILSQNNVFPGDALFIVGQIAGSIAIGVAESHKPLTEDKLEDIEHQIVEYAQQKVADALNIVRLKYETTNKN